MTEINDLAIAVIGMACRFPGANSPEAFWENISSGVESISFFTEQELIEANVDPLLIGDPAYVPAGAILDDVEHFDAAFFGFSPREAATLDPQQRLFMECAWEALERAGYAPHDYAGAISLYAGAGTSSYLLENLYPNRAELAATADMFQVQLGNDKDHLATRVAYKLNLRGPSVSVQTACSTSLVAIHMACQGLLSGESDMALAGGVALQLPQKAGYLHREGMILSSDGHCRAFDSRASGTVGGSGAGVVVLKRLSHALGDGDQIYAVVRGSAINNDGALKAGYTAPSASGQKAVIVEAMAIAGVDPESITLVEAHGTGTELGDPVEVAALTQAFRTTTAKRQFCALGTVKSNMGHLDAAAGVCGFIKTVLALHHRTLPPSLHFANPNPNIDFTSSPFYVNTSATEWTTGAIPRRAGVSSFGIGGTNAHVVLEEAPRPEASAAARPWQLLTLSAKSSTALETATRNLTRHLQQHPQANLADLAYTLQVGRAAMPYRRALVCQTLDEVVTRWEQTDQSLPTGYAPDNDALELAWLFPGQGTQFVNMARELYDHEQIFREQLDHCATILRPQLGLDLRELIYPAQLEGAQERLKQTMIAQPALFALEYALAQLWKDWGITPQRMLGHSIGEYVAACLSGVFTLEDALAIVALRGQLMQGMPGGAMLAVPLSEQALQPLLTPQLSLAAVNGPEHCVASGPHEPIAALEDALKARGVSVRRLQTSHAFHSTMMYPLLDSFAQQLAQLRLQPPSIPFLSNVTGDWISAEQATDPLYWVTQLHSTVRFSQGLEHLLRDPRQILLEVGPGRTLGRLASQHPARDPGQQVLASLRHPQEQQSDLALMLTSLGQLWMAGAPVRWKCLSAHERRQRVQLPAYPFERQRHWISAPRGQQVDQPGAATSAKKRAELAEWLYVPSWKRTSAPQPADDQRSRWLIFVDADGMGVEVARRLRSCGQQVVTVHMGQRFARVSADSYCIHPLEGDEYQQLFESLAADATLPHKIAHLWNLGSHRRPLADDAQQLSFYSLFWLAKAIGSRLLMDELELTALASGLYAVTGDEQLAPERALLVGPCKVLAQEYPHKRSRCVDLELPHNNPAALERVVEQIVGELLSPVAEQTVAYRGRYRWAQTFEPAALRRPERPAGWAREHGVYLITGGMGGMGLALSEHLARSVQARLVLVGRSALPPREHWARWLAEHGETEATSRKIAQIKQIESYGAEVELACADVGNLEQMRQVLARARRRFGRINGIIHAAGVAGENSMQRKTWAQAASVLTPKVDGTWVLDRLCREEPPELLVLCSSLRSIVGGAGQADYSAANAFLEAYAMAHHSQSASPAVLAISWDGWQEVGMSADTVRRLKRDPEPSLNASLTTAEGLQVFDWAIENALPQLIVSAIPLQAQIERERQPLDLASPTPAEQRLAMHPRPGLTSPYQQPADERERLLVEIWQELFGIEPVGVQDNFFELGGDSIIGLRAIARANERGLRLVPAQIFEHQTIAALARVAEQAQAPSVEELVSGPAPLAPMQRWFFEQRQPEPHHFNQALLLSVPAGLDSQHLQLALRQLALQHDALRLRFTPGESGWLQNHGPADEACSFELIDLLEIAPRHQPAALEEHATRLQASLDLRAGPLARAALFRRGHGQQDWLLLILHHLIVDGFSWRILQADFATALNQLAAGQPLRLPPKTSSFKAWAERLAAYAQSQQAEREAQSWLALARREAARLPVDSAGGENTVGSLQQLTVELSAQETQALLQHVPRVYHLQVQDIVLAALAQTLACWTDARTVAIDVEAQGRDIPLEGVDVTRTVGWFTALYPAVLELEPGQEPGELLRSVKQQLRAIPGHGLSYGALRSMPAYAERLAALPRAEIVFLYMGQLDDGRGAGMFAVANEPYGPTRSPHGKRPYLLEVSSAIGAGCLRIEWLYSQNIHRSQSIERLALGLLETLRALSAHSQAAEPGGHTPADFPLAGLNERGLEKLAALLGKGHQRKGI